MLAEKIDPLERLAQSKLQKHKENQRVRILIAEEHETAYREKKMGERGPTPETALRMRKHPIEDLYDRNILDDAEVRALSAIEEAYKVITHGARLRMSSPVLVDGNGGVDATTAREIDLVDRYGDWVDALAAVDKLPCFRVCIDIGVEGLTLSAISRRRGMNKNTIKKRLKEGLQTYGDVVRKVNRKS